MGEKLDLPVSDGHGLDVPRVQDEIYQAFANEPTPAPIDPSDGMPRVQPRSSVQDAYAPPLDPETMVCMPDLSRFALRNVFGDSLAVFEADEVVRSPIGQYRVSTQLAYERCKDSMVARRAADLAKEVGDEATLAALTSKSPYIFLRGVFAGMPELAISIEWIEVAPIRPQCKHYARQLSDFDDPDAKMLMRLCTARRTDEGEFVSLRDTVMYACELRSPPDLRSVEDLDRRDNELVQLGRKKKAEAEDVFDPDAAIDEQARAVATELGVELPRRGNVESLGVFGVAENGVVEVEGDDEDDDAQSAASVPLMRSDGS